MRSAERFLKSIFFIAIQNAIIFDMILGVVYLCSNAALHVYTCRKCLCKHCMHAHNAACGKFGCSFSCMQCSTCQHHVKTHTKISYLVLANVYSYIATLHDVLENAHDFADVMLESPGLTTLNFSTLVCDSSIGCVLLVTCSYNSTTGPYRMTFWTTVDRNY